MSSSESCAKLFNELVYREGRTCQVTEGEKMIWAAAFVSSLNSQGKAEYAAEDAWLAVNAFRESGDDVVKIYGAGNKVVQMYREMKSG